MNYKAEYHLREDFPKLEYWFEVKNGVKYFMFSDFFNEIAVPVSCIEKLQEDEWVYDSSKHNARKVK